MKNRKRKNTIMVLLILLLGITIGFAALATTLKINGNSVITKNTWSVYWDNVGDQSGVTPTTAPAISSEDQEHPNNIVSFEVMLDKPGDFYEFQVDAINDGTLDAMLDLISTTITSGGRVATLPDYISYTVTYADGVEPEQKHLLAKNTTERYKVRIEFLTTITNEELDDMPDEGLEYEINLGIPYIQADATAIDRHTAPASGFATDSWDTIKANVTNDKSSYNVGDTRILMLDLNGDSEEEAYFIRVANNTTPSECSTEGFSQTACGFVIEFIDIISEHQMNPYVSSTNAYGNGNQGGWEYSDMRAYLNSTTYTAGSINYATTGVYDKFPSDLKIAIIPTTVVSGYGSRDSANFTTTDNLYLLDAKELWGDEFNQSNNTAKDKERQLDYYHNEGVTMTDNNSAVIKYYEGDEYIWYLRTAMNDGRNKFYNVASNGGRGIGNTSSGLIGVSPAFRLAE